MSSLLDILAIERIVKFSFQRLKFEIKYFYNKIMSSLKKQKEFASDVNFRKDVDEFEKYLAVGIKSSEKGIADFIEYISSSTFKSGLSKALNVTEKEAAYLINRALNSQDTALDIRLFFDGTSVTKDAFGWYSYGKTVNLNFHALLSNNIDISRANIVMEHEMLHFFDYALKDTIEALPNNSVLKKKISKDLYVDPPGRSVGVSKLHNMKLSHDLSYKVLKKDYNPWGDKVMMKICGGQGRV